MAITYLSGERIQGSSTGTATLTYSNDFSSDNMVDVDSSKIGISGGVLNFDSERDGTNDASSWDLGSTLSDTAWVMRFKTILTTMTGNGGQNTIFMFFGMSSLPSSSGSSASHDFIGTQIKKNSGASVWKAQSVNGSNLDIEGTDFGHTATTETVYVEVKRTSATTGTVELFSDATYETSVESENISGITSAITGLQYFWAGNFDGSGGSTNAIVGTIDDVKIYNGVTEVAVDEKTTITNVPAGTRYEETDTRKIFRWKDEGFSASTVGIYGDLLSNDNGTLTNPTSAPTGIASAGNTKCFDSTGLQIKGRTGIDGNSARNWFPSGSDWTMAFWFKSDTWNVGGSNSPSVIGPRNSSNTSRAWFEFSSGPGTPTGDEPQFNVAMYQNGGGGNGKIEAMNYTGASSGAWHWMVIDWDDSEGTVTWSVDNDTSGVGYKTLTNSSITSLDVSTIDYWLVGSTAERYDGQVTDICFWNTLLTSQQKTNLWASGAGALATTESKGNIILYHDCQSITFPITNKATSPGWVEKGTA